MFCALYSLGLSTLNKWPSGECAWALGQGMISLHVYAWRHDMPLIIMFILACPTGRQHNFTKLPFYQRDTLDDVYDMILGVKKR